MRSRFALRLPLLSLALCPLGLIPLNLQAALEIPKLSETAQPKPGVPEGKVEMLRQTDSKVYPGTERDWAIYVPNQYQASGPPANCVVFLDGSGYLNPKGAARATLVLDNMIAAGELPLTVAVFVNPGNVPGKLPGARGRGTRSYEYDTPDGTCASFLLTEILPEVRKKVNLTTDPSGWAICGASSSAIAGFAAAWEHPEVFGNVISHIGSYTNIRGGYVYPALIRASKKSPKPIRVWMQDGESDLDNLHGHWPLSNQDMASALEWAGYDHLFQVTGGGHTGAPGGAMLPEALKWVFHPQPTAQPAEKKSESKPARHPDASPKGGVPAGQVVDMPVWKSKIFPDTERSWSVYIPAQYKNDGSAALMIFQDGHDYANRQGAWGVPTVLDNLIAAGEIPPMVAVFINPGNATGRELKSPWNSSNRSAEYDGLGDRFARFLLEEILPEVEKKWPVSHDPELRGLCGASSGGICAFTAAWERPDQFRRVLSTIGSFVNLRGGDVYPSWIRKTERKPLRVFLQDSSGDLDNPFGNWPIANQQMNAALSYMGYDVKFDWQEGFGHNSHRGGAIFPDAMRWLWRKEPTTALPGKTKDDLSGDLTLNKLLIDGESWQPVADGFTAADGLSADADGNLLVNDYQKSGWWRIAPDGTKTLITAENGSGAKTAPDGRVIFCQGGRNRLVAADLKTGTVEVLAEGVQPNDLVVTPQGWIYFTNSGKGEIVMVDLKTKALRTAATGIATPNGIALSPDGGTLAASEYTGGKVWVWRIGADGTLDAGMPFMTLRQRTETTSGKPILTPSGGDGMCSDADGRWYVTTALGVQVFDPTGRECGLLTNPPTSAPVSSVTIAGPDHHWLCVAAGNQIFRRRITAKAGS